VEVIERVAGHYEAQDVEFGRVYRWCPECAVIECACGERQIFDCSSTVCECGMDHADDIREQLSARRLGDKELHPWRYVRNREGAGLPY
jgi:hypothetical protein